MVCFYKYKYFILHEFLIMFIPLKNNTNEEIIFRIKQNRKYPKQ